MRERRTYGHRFCDKCGSDAVRYRGRARLLGTRYGVPEIDLDPDSEEGEPVALYACLDCYPRGQWFERMAEAGPTRNSSFAEGLRAAVARHGA